MNININNQGGTVNIVPPILGKYREPPHRAQRKNWKRSWRLLGIYFTLSSCRVKMRHETHERSLKLARNDAMVIAGLRKYPIMASGIVAVLMIIVLSEHGSTKCVTNLVINHPPYETSLERRKRQPAAQALPQA